VTVRLRPLLACLVPLVLASADPSRDVGPCGPIGGPTGTPGDQRVDIVAARALTVENGTALEFSVTFATPLDVPDDEGSPFRVDVVLRDPDVPAVSFRYYRNVNRIIRYDAVPDALVQILLLPERGANVFAGAAVHGPTLTLTVPGRLVRRDRDLEGLGLRRLRWTVIARDESDCDVLGDGVPDERVRRVSGASPAPAPDQVPAPPEDAPPSPRVWLIGLVLGAAILAALAIVRWRGARRQAQVVRRSWR
jgi:hypothetical protein